MLDWSEFSQVDTYYNIDVEQAVICSCISDGGIDSISKCVKSGITGETFFEQKHQKLWSVLAELNGEGVPLEPILVMERLQKNNLIEQIGGMGYFDEITFKVDSYVQLPEWIDLLKRREVARKATRQIRICAEALVSGKADEIKVIDELSDELSKFQSELKVKREKTKEEIQRYLDERIDRSKTGKSPEKIVYMPFTWFDEKFDLIEKDESIYLAARPNVGKSSLMIQILIDSMRAGCKTKEEFLAKEGCYVYFSVEMTPEGLLMRAAEQRARVNEKRLDREPKEAVEKYESWLNSFMNVFDKKLFIIQTNSLSDMNNSLKRIEGRHGKINLICVEYIQNVIAPGVQEQGTPLALGVISRTFKEWTYSTGYGCPNIIGAQINRDSSKEGLVPKLHDIKGSGSIEQDADRVWILHRPKEIDFCGKRINDQMDMDQHHYMNPVQIKFYQEKGRNAPIGQEKVAFYRSYKKFQNWVE